jgi:hypothetical protein
MEDGDIYGDSVVVVEYYLCRSVRRRRGSNWREASSFGGKTPYLFLAGTGYWEVVGIDN